MFDRAIIDTDRFMDLSMSAKALYFLLGMEADDEGFVSYKKVMRIHGGNEDDIKILLAKEFLIGFPSGVVVITDWNTNNWLDIRRIRPTEYQKEKESLLLTENNKYVLSKCLASIEESSIEEKSVVELLSDESEKISISFYDWMYDKGYRQEPSAKEINECYPLVWCVENELGSMVELKASELNKLRKEYTSSKTPEKAPTRRDTPSEDEVVVLWNKFTRLGQNGVPRECQNPSCRDGILPESRMTPDIKTQIKKHAYKYKDLALWELAFKNYAKEIMARWEDDKGYFKHRMSLYEFLLQKNGFIKYVNR